MGSDWVIAGSSSSMLHSVKQHVAWQWYWAGVACKPSTMLPLLLSAAGMSHAAHSGESSLSPKEPSSSLTRISACSTAQQTAEIKL